MSVVPQTVMSTSNFLEFCSILKIKIISWMCLLIFLLIMKISYKEKEGCFSIISIFIGAGLCWPESPLRCQVPKAVGNSRGR